METISRKTKSLGKKENLGELQNLYRQYGQYDEHALRLILANSEAKHAFREGVIAVTAKLLQALILPIAVFLLVVAAKWLPDLTTSVWPWLTLLFYCFFALVLLIYLLLLYGKMLNFFTKRRIYLILYLLETKQAAAKQTPTDRESE